MFRMLLSDSGGRGAAGFLCLGGGGCRLPVGGQEGGEVVLIGHRRKPGEDIGEPGLGAVAVAAGAFHHGVDNGGALAGGFAADKEVVFLADGGGADAVFNQIVVDLEAAVFKVKVEPVPEGEGVVDGFAKRAFGQDFGALAEGDEVGLEDLQDGGGVLLAELAALFGTGAIFPCGGLGLIDPLGGGERAGGEGLAAFERIVEFPAGVGPASRKDDAAPGGGPGVVGFIAVGLEGALIAFKKVVEACGLPAGMPLVKDVSLDAIQGGSDGA
jgi:hypothetical protein